MAGSVNKVILIGNCGRDPEIRFTQAGKKIANLRLATSESWRDRQSGERRERTEWHTVVVFSEGLANVVEKYVRKGSKLYIEGQLRTRKWQGQDGRDNYSTEVVLDGFGSTLTMLDGRSESGGGYGGGNDYGASGGEAPSGGGAGGGQSGGGQSAGGWSGGGAPNDDLDDEIPF